MVNRKLYYLCWMARYLAKTLVLYYNKSEEEVGIVGQLTVCPTNGESMLTSNMSWQKVG